jgi:hypothetical protein
MVTARARPLRLVLSLPGNVIHLRSESVERVSPPGGYSTGLAEPEARSVQQISDRGRRVTFTWFDPRFRPEPPHTNQAYGICFTAAGMIVLGACDVDGGRYWNLLGGGVETGAGTPGQETGEARDFR